MTNIPEYIYGERREVVGWIPDDQYVSMIDNMPIFCVDTLIEDSEGAFLIGERLNRPFKGMLVTVGGKKSRNETWVEAACRNIKKDTFLDILANERFTYVSTYQIFNDEREQNPIEKGLDTPGVFLHIKVTDEEKAKMLPVGDLREICWVSKDEILSDTTEKIYMAPIVDAIKALESLREKGVC